MAKKIRLDFSKVEERSQYNSRQIPEGLYEARVSGYENRDASDGTAMLIYGLKPTSKKYATRNFSFYCKLQQNQLWKLRDLFVAAGESVEKKKGVQLDPEKVLGKKIVIEVADGTGQYADRSEVISVYPLDALEGLSDEDDDDEEEYDEDESDDEDYDDEDDSDDEDDDDEYEDDDEDLDEDDDDEYDDEDDDDDDDDEEDEDEEDEEPEEKPKKRTPAKKAPAKKSSAKAAPAKRTVKRRR